MVKKLSTLNKDDKSKVEMLDIHQLSQHKIKHPNRWFNFVIIFEVIGICICIGLIVAQLIKIFA